MELESKHISKLLKFMLIKGSCEEIGRILLPIKMDCLELFILNTFTDVGEANINTLGPSFLNRVGTQIYGLVDCRCVWG